MPLGLLNAEFGDWLCLCLGSDALILMQCGFDACGLSVIYLFIYVFITLLFC